MAMPYMALALPYRMGPGTWDMGPGPGPGHGTWDRNRDMGQHKGPKKETYRKYMRNICEINK